MLRESVGLHMDLALLHSCTFVSIVTELSCALGHYSNAFALAQGASQNRVSFDITRGLTLLSPKRCSTRSSTWRVRERDRHRHGPRHRFGQRETHKTQIQIPRMSGAFALNKVVPKKQENMSQYRKEKTHKHLNA